VRANSLVWRLTLPRPRPHRILDFPPLRVFFGIKSGFFTAFPAAPQVSKFFCFARSFQ
jgi:hypothetical protein